MPTTTFERTDGELLNIIQASFPLVERPYLAIAGQLGVSEDEVIERIGALRKKNIVRQISAIFDTRRLGYRSCLVAMRFAPGDLDRGAQVINAHPGVSHNYARDDIYNLWFTLAVPPDGDLEQTVARLEKSSGAKSSRLLPTLRFFKIGVNFDILRQKSDSTDYFAPDAGTGGTVQAAGASVDGWNERQPLSDRDIEVVRELQEDIDLVPRPFDGMARRLGLSLPELFGHAEDMMRRRLMRRYSAVLHHRRAGFAANAMVVWRVPPARAQEVGDIMASSPAVTHCYQRPTYNDIPYSHYTMIHATTREECEAIAEQISRATGITDRRLLYSTREYKKTRVRYFVEDRQSPSPRSSKG